MHVENKSVSASKTVDRETIAPLTANCGGIISQTVGTQWDTANTTTTTTTPRSLEASTSISSLVNAQRLVKTKNGHLRPERESLIVGNCDLMCRFLPLWLLIHIYIITLFLCAWETERKARRAARKISSTVNAKVCGEMIIKIRGAPLAQTNALARSLL
jgi:hypothetical protein